MMIAVDCQRCREAFDDRRDARPNCGGSETWRRGGRYGLGRPGLGSRD